MSKIKFDTIIRITCYNKGLTAGAIKTKVDHMHTEMIKAMGLTSEEISTIKSGKGESLLQMAAQNNNPYLTAFYLNELIQTSSLSSDDMFSAIKFVLYYPEFTMKKAIFSPFEFLLENGLVDKKSNSLALNQYKIFCKKCEKEYREKTEPKIKSLFELTSTKSDDTEFLKNYTKYIACQELLPREVNFDRYGDGWSLLHAAVYSKNPYLTALYIHLGSCVEYKPKGAGVSPKDLCQKIWGKWDDVERNAGNIMEIAFKHPKEFLVVSGIIPDPDKFGILGHDKKKSAFKRPQDLQEEDSSFEMGKDRSQLNSGQSDSMDLFEFFSDNLFYMQPVSSPALGIVEEQEFDLI